MFNQLYDLNLKSHDSVDIVIEGFVNKFKYYCYTRSFSAGLAKY